MNKENLSRNCYLLNPYAIRKIQIAESMWPTEHAQKVQNNNSDLERNGLQSLYLYLYQSF